MDDARLSRLVRQHALTSRLMGVDFVPSFVRGPGVAAPDGMDAGAEPGPATLVAPTAGVAAVVAEAAEVARGRPAPGARASKAPDETGTIEIKPARVSPPVVTDAKPAASAEKSTPGAASAKRDRPEAQAALDALRARYEAEAPHRRFVTAHTRIVFGEGDPCARLVFVGEAPGEEEDRTGRPFVGRSGELLTKMIVAMGLSREHVYICNVMKTRPPNNATPTASEIEICEPYLREQLAIIGPEAIVTLGLPAARALLHTQESMTKMRGRWREYELGAGRVVPLMPTFHPAYVLRNYTDETRGQVWSDLCMVLEKLGLPRPARAKG